MLETSIKLFLIGLVGILSPGPDFILIVRNSINYTREKALYSAYGINLGIFIHLALNMLGIGFIVKNSKNGSLALQYIGACYLFYIGFKTLFSKPIIVKKDSFGQTQKQEVSRSQAFREGFFSNLFNLKALLIFLSIFTQIIDKNTRPFEMFVYGMIFVIQSAVYWPVLITILQHSRFENFISKNQKLMNKIF
jgi:threonine/homoserine/homoserine lactone efflux protein